MSDSSTNIYCVPAKVISTGSGLSTCLKMHVVRNLLFPSSCVLILRVFHETMLFFMFGFQSLVFADAAAADTRFLNAPLEREPHSHGLGFVERFSSVGSVHFPQLIFQIVFLPGTLPSRSGVSKHCSLFSRIKCYWKLARLTGLILWQAPLEWLRQTCCGLQSLCRKGLLLLLFLVGTQQ